MNGQTKRWSLLEAVANNVISFGISVFAQWAVFPLFGIHVGLTTNVALVLMFTAISLVRSYALRRLFNWLTMRGVR